MGGSQKTSGRERTMRSPIQSGKNPIGAMGCRERVDRKVLCRSRKRAVRSPSLNNKCKKNKLEPFTRRRDHQPIRYTGRKVEPIHKAVRPPTRYTQKVARDTYAKTGGKFLRPACPQGEGFSRSTITRLATPTGGKNAHTTFQQMERDLGYSQLRPY